MEEITTTRNQFLALLTITAILFVVFCLALYNYDQRHNASAQTVTKARAAVSAATVQNNALSTQNKALTTQNATLTTRNTELQNEKTQFCGELGKVKINDPLCTE